jgi:hypothetical protein
MRLKFKEGKALMFTYVGEMADDLFNALQKYFCGLVEVM